MVTLTKTHFSWALGLTTGLSILTAMGCVPQGNSVEEVVTSSAIDERSLGARFQNGGQNIEFRVFSAHATRIELWLYAQADGPVVTTRVLGSDPNSGVWSTTLSTSNLQSQHGLTPPYFYGYRAWGPNWPYDANWTPGTGAGFIADVDSAGHRFNPNKLLLDPYAREMSHDPVQPLNTDATLFATGPSYRNLDSGPVAPKGILTTANTDDVGPRPTRALIDDVIYEVHVRGLTMNPQNPKTPKPQNPSSLMPFIQSCLI